MIGILEILIEIIFERKKLQSWNWKFWFKLKIIFRNFRKIILQKNCFDENWIAKNNSWKTNALAIEFARRTSDWTRKNENVVCTRCGLIFPSPRRETALSVCSIDGNVHKENRLPASSRAYREMITRVRWIGEKTKGFFFAPSINTFLFLSLSLYSCFTIHNVDDVKGISNENCR